MVNIKLLYSLYPNIVPSKYMALETEGLQFRKD